MIRFENYNEIYLEKSWFWLNDSEIKLLTMTPDFTKKQQQEWFEGLLKKENYKIWGISFNEFPVGVFGLKNIDKNISSAEYWGYIGEKEYWGKGIGKDVLSKILKIAKNDLNLKSVYLKVLNSNIAAISLYNKMEFIEIENDGKKITMIKKL